LLLSPYPPYAAVFDVSGCGGWREKAALFSHCVGMKIRQERPIGSSYQWFLAWACAYSVVSAA